MSDSNKSVEAKPESKSVSDSQIPVKQISQAEYDTLMQKVANYDLIATDPELATKVMDHFRAKTGKVAETPKPQPKNIVKESNPEIEDRFMSMSRRQAELEIKLFQKDHPDFEQHKDAMAKLLQRHPTMDLEEAYNFSKGSSSKPEQKSSQQTAVATTETNKTAAIPESSNAFSDVEKRINDPKATPHLDDAIAAAWEFAKNSASTEDS